MAGAGRSVISSAAAGDDPIAVAVDSGLNLVFVANCKSRTISVLAGQNASLVATIPTNGAGSPTALAVNARTHRLYELDATLMQLVVIDAGSRAPLLTLPVGSGSRWVAVDEQSNRIFV